MGEEQIWAQLELRSQNICQILAQALEGAGEDGDADMIGEGAKKLKLDDEEGMDEGEDDKDEEEDEDDDEEDEGEEDEESEDDAVDLGENVEALRDPSSEEEDDDEDNYSAFSSLLSRSQKPKPSSLKRRGGHSELDDGFFDLAEFNAETEAAEARSSSKGRLADDDDVEDDDNESVDLFASVDGAANLEDLGGSGGAELFYLLSNAYSRTVTI